MRTIAIPVLCALVFTFCFSTGNQRNPTQTTSTAIQGCPDSEYIIQENGRSSNSWRGLLPLKSTRTDVEALMGKANWSFGSTSTYDISCGRLNVVYSKGSCELTEVQRWNVPQDVVIRMEFAPRTVVRIKDLNLPANRYTQQQQLHPENWVEYRNIQDGILINALRDKKGDTVAIITYKPEKRQEELLLCPPNGPNSVRKL